MKKYLLSIIMLALPILASAYDCKVGGIYYNIKSENNAEVTYGDLKYHGKVSIPQKFTYKNVEYSVTSIGRSAFNQCDGLTSVTIPNSVTSIGYGAFWNCDGLTSLTIPNSVTSIGDYAFFNCSGLTSIKVENGNTQYDSRDNCNAIIETKTNTLIAGCQNTFIPNSVTSIGGYAFYICTGLTSVTIPNSVTSIGGDAFYKCTGLTSVTIPNSVTSIGDRAFEDCSSLTSVTIGNSVTSIGEWAFGSCFHLTSITIPNSVTSIGDHAFANCRLTSIKVESGNTNYDSRDNCNAIIETNTNTLIVGCQNTVIPNSVTSIGDWAFGSCDGLTSLSIPNPVTSIGDRAFFGCDGLTSLSIPNSVTSIGDGAFANSHRLEEIICLFTKPMTISEHTFNQSSYSSAKLIVPYGTKDAFKSTDFWSKFTEIVEAAPTPTDAVTITAKSYTITYGDPLPTFGYTTTGSPLQGTPTVTCSATSSSNVGTYSIIVSKGSVSNSSITFVNGMLTIKKAVLTASVGEYTRKTGEDNPKFNITYNGFKNGESKSVLDSEPTASCDATKDSPSGTYLITLSGGSARNYDFKYENGVLRVVRNGYTLSIMSIGKGTVIFGNETVSQNNSLSTTVFPDEQYTVTFRPDKGYKLGKLLWNDKDVLVDIVNNTYTISNVSQNCTLIAMYEESLGEFTANGITYEILSSSENTVAVTKGNYTGQIEIPATVTDNGIKWSVVGIQNFAFSNTPIITAVIPESVRESSMGGGIFSGCQALAAITWNAGFAMTGNVLSGLSNPNLLFYTKNASYAPSVVKNVVVNGTAEEITLTDAEGSSNFYCPTEFTARKISYTHNYTMTSGFGGKAQGWETLALPFDVKEISHEAKGDILPFAAWNSSSPARPFWLYGLSSSGFSRASSILANTPYIICMPNNEEYDTDYILAGAVTFSATDAKVKASSALIPGKSGTKTFTPAFCAQEKSNGVYVLNVNNDWHRELGGYDEGSRFVSNLRAAGPFEAYMTDSSAGAKQAIGIEFSDATGIDELLTGTTGGGQMNTVYTLSGQLVVRTCSAQEMLRALEQLPEGVYIVNGKKKHVK